MKRLARFLGLRSGFFLRLVLEVIFPVQKTSRQPAGTNTGHDERYEKPRISQASEAVGSQWQSYMVLAVVLGFALYCLAGLLLSDRVGML